MSELAVIVLAAGQGTRMKSQRAKVLHEICGLPMLEHVLRAARALSPSRLIAVIGHGASEVRERFDGEAELVLQAEQRGTGHAVATAERAAGPFEGEVLILYGDTPLLRPETLERMRAVRRETGAGLVMLTAHAETIPGRVLRDDRGRIRRIVEAQDAGPEELAIRERNTGVYLCEASLLRDGLASLRPDNEQGELYVTDVVGHAVEKGVRVEALVLPDAEECLGINTRAELADATRVMRRRIAERHMEAGVTFVDPAAVYLDADVRVGRDTVLDPGVVITGASEVGERVHVKAGCVIEESRLGDDVEIGPSAHLRPGSDLRDGVKVGNYVEIKNSTLGPGSKASHLGYIGDADVGAGVNFSCGAIVVNYDGRRKTRTRIGDGAFIGCNVNLVSPVDVARHTFVAAGSTITHDVPEDALAIARERQRNVEGWVARREGRPGSRAQGAGRGPSSARASRQAPARDDGAGEPVGREAGARSAAGRRPGPKVRKKTAGRPKAARKKAATRKKKGAIRKKTTGKQGTRKKAAKKGSSSRGPAEKRAAKKAKKAKKADGRKKAGRSRPAKR